jgi:hypothetical protein
LIGSTDFRRRSTELAKEVDNTYNKLLSGEHERAVKGPKFLQHVQSKSLVHNLQGRAKQPENRKYRFVNILMTCQSPPLQQNRRFPVSDDDIINYSAIVELAHSAQHKK